MKSALLSFLALSTLVASGIRAAEKAQALRIGMNLSPVVDYNREWVFVDVFKQSRSWISQHPGSSNPWNTKTPFDLQDGWPLLKPGQAAATLIFRDVEHYPRGEYVCTWKGTGDIAFDMDAKVKSRTGNSAVLEVQPTMQGIYLRIDRSQRNDPIRDLRILMPGVDDAKSPFHPLFVERLRPFRVIRFMDWARTNNNDTLQSWSQRTTPVAARQTEDHGVAAEFMIDLCNELHAEPWFCMPHLANDDYVRQFATLVRKRLQGQTHIYVEWSNETWNTLFSQTKWINREAQRTGRQPAAVVAAEAANDWRIWQEVFKGDEQRVIRVLAGQHYNLEVARSRSDALQGNFDAIACGGYFFASEKDISGFNAKTTAEDVVQSCIRNIKTECLTKLTQHKQLAGEWSKRLKRDIPLLVYEGGQHLSLHGKDAPYARAFQNAQTIPQMKEAYTLLLDGARDLGVETFLAFNYVGGPSNWGSMGHLQAQDEPLDKAPKYQALLDASTR